MIKWVLAYFVVLCTYPEKKCICTRAFQIISIVTVSGRPSLSWTNYLVIFCLQHQIVGNICLNVVVSFRYSSSRWLSYLNMTFQDCKPYDILHNNNLFHHQINSLLINYVTLATCFFNSYWFFFPFCAGKSPTVVSWGYTSIAYLYFCPCNHSRCFQCPNYPFRRSKGTCQYQSACQSFYGYS